MHHRYPVQLTTMEEDFRAIGLLPQNQLTEEREMYETDDPRNPRDIPSPDPSTLGGLDKSGDKINTKAHHATGMQPRPAIAPSEKNDHDDPMDAGGSQGGKAKGSYSKKPNYREGAEYDVDEGYEEGPDGSHGYSQYDVIAKKPGMMPTDKKNADQGKNPDRAEGNTPVKKHAGMYKKESGTLGRAAELMSEVEALLRGAQVSEEVDQLYRGFNLLGEDAALLADRLTEISDEYEVEHIVTSMEALSEHAVEMLNITEMADTFSKDKKKAIKNGEYMPEDDEEIDLEDIKRVFQAMTLDLMDAVEAYDRVLSEMGHKDKDYKAGHKDKDDDDDYKGMSTKEKMHAMKKKMHAKKKGMTSGGY